MAIKTHIDIKSLTIKKKNKKKTNQKTEAQVQISTFPFTVNIWMN